MKTILLTGSHPRHLYIAKQLAKNGLLQGLLLEEREEFEPSSPAGLLDVDRNNFIRHFRDRSEAERRWFGSKDDESTNIPAFRVTPAELNSDKVKQWVRAMQPDTVLSFGVHKLSAELLAEFPERAWNIHGGLSPWFKGAITLFWPFYFLQPNWAGMTIHRLTSALDGGEIVHHSVPSLERGDGIHDVACRAVKQAAEDVVTLLQKVDQGQEPALVKQRSNGKLFLAADWKPQHLRLIYNSFDNDIVDRYLDGEFGHQEPPLVRAF